AVEELRERVKEERERSPEEVKGYLKDILAQKLEDEVAPLNFAATPPTVVLVMGVNGVGKTTSIAKLAYLLKQEGKRVLLAAGDTFRAAAIEQLEIWSERAGVEFIKHQKDSDPAAVIYDALSAAKARGIDVVICDTAGRLHTKVNLMEELKKIYRVSGKAVADAPHEVLLVLDATTGQNALNQARLFGEVSKISGIILTKLDGTAKGGIVIAIKEALDIPIKYIGVGESLEDLHEFNPREFVEALFD
ncbi:MAG: signal recognition particle-docking protein FtsY, partial [Tindallia sp. MSAO_Bac2]